MSLTREILTKRSRLIVSTLAIFILVALAACSGPSLVGSGEFLPIYELKEVELTGADKTYLIEEAYRLLDGKPATPQPPDGAVTQKSVRGLFVSYAVPQTRAQVSFGMGMSLQKALENAVASLRDKLGPDWSWHSGILKIDVVNGSGQKMALSLEGKVDWERTLTGMIFDLKPPIALLPEEATGWNIISDKGKLQKNNLKNYLKFQKRGRILGDVFSGEAAYKGNTSENPAVDYTTFTTISFGMVDQKQHDFYRGTRLITELEAQEYLERAKVAAKQLERFVDSKGKFLYMYRPSLDRDYQTYNELRHCGSVYSMLEVYEVAPDEQLLAASKRAIDYILLRLDGPNPEDSKVDWLAIKGRGRDSKRKTVHEAKLGGAGLCLLMLCKYESVTGDLSYRDKMIKLARFIEFMQHEDGKFDSKYYYAPTDEQFESLYYPGEAMLALMRFYGRTGNRHWVEIAAKGMDYIALVRDRDRTPKNVEPDHWVLYALNELYRAEPREHYVTHLKKIGEGIRLKMIHSSKHPDFIGSFSRTVRSTPAATRNEGMIAGYKLLTMLKDPDAASWLEVIRNVVRFQTYCQFLDENVIYLRNPAKPYGGFKEGLLDFEMRIDYTQHNISALLGYYQILMQEKKEKN